MKVFVLNCGTMTIDRSQVLWNVDCGVKLRFPIYAVLVDHPDGLFLFDTGHDVEHAARTFPWEHAERGPGTGVVEQLRACGYAPGDVRWVVNSHLHFDHVGGNRHFPAATTVVSRQELRQAKVPEPFERLAYSDQSFDHDAVRYELLDEETDLAPGLRLVETSGHSVGHFSLLVRPSRRARAMLFTFDAAYSIENIEREIVSGFHHDPVAGTQSLRKIRRLVRAHDAELFVAHDATAFSGYRKPPAFYGPETGTTAS